MLCTSSILLLLLILKSIPLKTNTKQKNCMTPKVLTKLGCKTADDYKCLCGKPKDAVKNLRTMIEKFNAYGEYGFYDAINPKTGKVATKYMCLDQAMSLIALNNYLNNGAIRKRFHADPIAKNAEELLKVENFFE